MRLGLGPSGAKGFGLQGQVSPCPGDREEAPGPAQQLRVLHSLPPCSLPSHLENPVPFEVSAGGQQMRIYKLQASCPLKTTPKPLSQSSYFFPNPQGETETWTHSDPPLHTGVSVSMTAHVRPSLESLAWKSRSVPM